MNSTLANVRQQTSCECINIMLDYIRALEKVSNI